MGDGFARRKVWVEKRLKLLAYNYAVSVAAFAIMHKHSHILLRLDPEIARNWWALIRPSYGMTPYNKTQK